MLTWRTESIAAEIKNNYIFNQWWAETYRLGVQHTPLCLLGPPGIGKTEGVRQAARTIAADLNRTIVEWNDFENLNMEDRAALITRTYQDHNGPFFFVEINLSTHDPADFSGHPERIMEKIPTPEGSLVDHPVTSFAPMKWAKYMQNFPGIIFIDEFTNVNRQDLRSISLKVLEGKIGYTSTSPHCQVIVAGNNMGESSMALPLSEPTINRIQLVNIAPPTALGWLQYIETTYGGAVDYTAAGYLSNLASTAPDPKPLPDYLPQQNQRAFVTPRSCDLLLRKISALRLARQSGILTQEDFYKGVEGAAMSLIGEKEGTLFTAWYKNQSLLEETLQNPDKIASLSPSQICGLAVILGRKIGSLLETATPDQDIATLLQPLEMICNKGKEYAGLVIFSSGVLPARDFALDHLGPFFSKFTLLRCLLDQEVARGDEATRWQEVKTGELLDMLSDRSFLNRPTLNLRDTEIKNPFYTVTASPLSKIFVQSVQYLVQDILDVLLKDLLRDMKGDSAQAIIERIKMLQEVREKL